MIDLTQLQPDDVCECGNPECLGAAEVVTQVVDDLIASALPTLQSPLLKLKKERDEARRLCALLAGSYPDLALCLKSDKALTNANAEMHEALMTYCKTKKHWDKRSYEIGGGQ